jgi:hypothetical protein
VTTFSKHCPGVGMPLGASPLFRPLAEPNPSIVVMASGRSNRRLATVVPDPSK